MAIDNTMTLINSVTVGAGGAANIEFTSIPQTYTDLCIVLSTRQSPASTQDTIWLKDINGVTGSFTDIVDRGDGSSASSFTPSETPFYIGQSPCANATASTFASHSVYIPNYTSSNNKSIAVNSAQEIMATTAYMGFTGGVWASSSAITSIKFEPNGGTFVQYSTAYLYGVKSVSYGSKATGGLITQDDNYYYHTFLSSGVFTPTISISADILCIAGGGGGGRTNGGGGGAGGLLYFGSQSLTATGYTVTVGAGAAGGTSFTSNGSNGNDSQFSALTVVKGGGTGASGGANANGNTGGSGGGAGGANYSATGGSPTSGQGNAGGNTDITNYPQRAAGGGGAGGAAASYGQAGFKNGGIGVDTYASWAIATTTGVNGYYAGGGGGGVNSAASGAAPAGAGGLGGGANGNSQALQGVPYSAIINTGGGGGGSGGNGDTANGGNGGSGLIIVRYAK